MAMNNCDEQMQSQVTSLKKELSNVRTGRANPKLLDKIFVEYYGTSTALPQIANINVPEARQIVITPYDSSILKAIIKSIASSDLGLTPVNDGECIRLNIPPLTEDVRRELVKKINKTAEEYRVRIRNIRHEFINLAKNDKSKGKITEDNLKTIENDVQKLTDKYVGIINNLIEVKSKELMTV
jgi:ribosome recycling factor